MGIPARPPGIVRSIPASAFLLPQSCLFVAERLFSGYVSIQGSTERDKRALDAHLSDAAAYGIRMLFGDCLRRVTPILMISRSSAPCFARLPRSFAIYHRQETNKSRGLYPRFRLPFVRPFQKSVFTPSSPSGRGLLPCLADLVQPAAPMADFLA